MSDSTTDEIDLGVVFSKIKEGFNNFLISIYYGIQFLIKNWWVILLVAIIGGTIGYFTNKNRELSKTTTIIIQNSFNSSSYVYSAIEQLNNNTNNSDYLTKNNIDSNGVIKSIEIEPIVNILEILEKTKYSFRAIEPLLEKADFEDELLTSEVFNTDYKYHRITLNTSKLGSEKTIQSIIDYLNNNPKMNEIKAVVVEDTKSHIEEINITLEGINNVMRAFSEKTENNSKASQIYISAGSVVTDLGALIEKKANIMREREIYKTELVKYDKIVTVLNIPSLYNKPSLIAITYKSMALIFVFTFLILAFLRNKFLKVKIMAENKLNK